MKILKGVMAGDLIFKLYWESNLKDCIVFQLDNENNLRIKLQR